MAWKVTVTPEIARLRSGDSGSRNVLVGKGTKDQKLYTFNRNATVVDLDELPDEIKNDPHLRVSEATAKEVAAPPAPPVNAEPVFVEAGKEDEVLAEVSGPEPEPEASAEPEPAVEQEPAPEPAAAPRKRGRPAKATAKK